MAKIDKWNQTTVGSLARGKSQGLLDDHLMHQLEVAVEMRNYLAHICSGTTTLLLHRARRTDRRCSRSSRS